ncbi:TatD family hydrolase [Marinobacterium marinum]|uniref:TatD family hydrolase n=1 Tax=Marinobacterium marinum TaxID=2756129 RepID=A0A7W1WYZ5_9GAMM|nr:TatD family hydrolase [Marinobacterium marinum]MBA4502824.1 TatD family hydrolase [Marinobacterium marinum]
MLIDTHCHLDFPVFAADRPGVLARARLAGVQRMVVPAVDVDNFQSVLALCAEASDLYPALGLHPCFSHDAEPDLATLTAALVAHPVVAIGEAGLDYRPGQMAADRQRALLERQLQLACRHELPLLLHVVKAHDQVLALLRRYRPERGGIIHAFSGSEQQARAYATLGFKLGIGGIITHTRARKQRRLAAELPLEWLVLETDAPDMPLADYRDLPNEPARVAEVAAVLAELRGLSVAEVIRVTGSTAQQLLRLPPY